jgi:signal transduction histidine kinase
VNLLGNAIQHTPERSTVGLEVTAGDGMIVYTVRDQGPGIPEGDLEGVFDIYASKKPEDMRGVGLGLPLSRRLARLLGGNLRAFARPGSGGEFVLELPAAAES